MRLLTSTSLGLLGLLAIPLAGCAAEPDEHSDEQTNESVHNQAEGSQQQLLTTLDLGDGHTIEFYRLQDGSRSVLETVSNGRNQTALLTMELRSKPLAEIYATLASRGSSVPQALKDSDSEYNRLRLENPEAVEVAEPTQGPVAEVAEADGPAFYTDAEQAAFRDANCVGQFFRECPQGNGTVGSNWWPAREFFAIGAAHSGGEADLTAYHWNGSFWEIWFSKHLTANTTAFTILQALPWGIFAAGVAGNTQVSLAVHTINPVVNASTSRSGLDKSVNVTGSYFYGDTSVSVYLCQTDRNSGCYWRTNATVLSDGSFSASFPFSCSTNAHTNNNNAYVQVVSQGANYSKALGYPSLYCP